MIQRIQTVFLAVAALLGFGTLAVPSWKYEYQNETENVSALQMYAPLDADTMRSRWFFDTPAHLVWFVTTVLVSLFLLVIIFQYKNRMRQIRLCQIAIIGIGIQIAAMMMLVMNEGPHWILGGANTGTPFIGFGMMILNLILVWFASKRIKADEDLVRSADRFR